MLEDIKVSNFSWMNYGDDSVIDIPGVDVRYVDLVNLSNLGIMDSRDGDTQYTIKEGDRLDALAKDFYGDQLLWWVIAYRNSLEFPTVQLNPGLILIMPDPIFVKNEIEL